MIDVLTAHSYFNQQFSQSHGWKSPVNLLANGDGLFDNGGIFGLVTWKNTSAFEKDLSVRDQKTPVENVKLAWFDVASVHGPFGPPFWAARGRVLVETSSLVY